MDTLTQINETKLAECLEAWFTERETVLIINKNFWARNVVGKVIKNKLNSIGKWKYRARGNPRKGRRVMLEKKARRDEF